MPAPESLGVRGQTAVPELAAATLGQSWVERKAAGEALKSGGVPASLAVSPPGGMG